MRREGPPASQLATIRADRDPVAGTTRAHLVVIVAGAASTHILPEAGEIVVGRSAECTVPIDDPSISRRHARLVLGPPMTIEDLGSANGTRLRDTSLEPGKPAPLSSGEIVELGAILMTVQQGPAPSAPRRIWAHGYFEARLEDECTRAAGAGAGFALIRTHTDARADATVRALLSDLAGPDDVLGLYGPGEHELILVGATPERAADVTARLRAVVAEVDPSVRLGFASFPRDARDPWSLAARASAALHGRPSPAAAAPIVQDEAMRELYRVVERVAVGNIAVLLLGETGVGKEVLAATVHRLSPRRDQPFLRLNCAALSETLLESELFGHEKAAFTGAVAAKPGLLESAEGGTVFLDEVGELPMSTQVKLLRVLEDRQVMRVGSVKSKPIDVRFVSATNRDLEAEVARGAFRQDLYFRINGVSVVIPPLRRRTTEIPTLARAFAELASEQLGRPTPEIQPATMALLRSYAWPGNIRELRNFMERAVLLCTSGAILPEHLPIEKMAAVTAQTHAPMPAAPPCDPERPAVAPASQPSRGAETSVAQRMHAQVLEAQRQAILDALDKTGGNQTEAAKLLGVSRRTMSTWLDEHGIARPRKGKRA